MRSATYTVTVTDCNGAVCSTVGSEVISVPAGTVDDGRRPNVSGRTVPGATVAPVSVRATVAPVMRSGIVPYGWTAGSAAACRRC